MADISGPSDPSGEAASTPQAASAPEAKAPGRRGLPVWLPLAMLMAAFVFAIVVGAMVCPVLSVLLFPPDPPLPPGDVVLVQPVEAQGVGRDEWLYSSSIPACAVLKYYRDRIGGCSLDPEAPCDQSGDQGVRPRDGASYPIGVCQGIQTIGSSRLAWTIRVGGGYAGPHTTRFRITREVAN